MNVRMLSLSGAVQMTHKLHEGEEGMQGAERRLLVVAASFQMSHVLFVDVLTVGRCRLTLGFYR